MFGSGIFGGMGGMGGGRRGGMGGMNGMFGGDDDDMSGFSFPSGGMPGGMPRPSAQRAGSGFTNGRRAPSPARPDARAASEITRPLKVALEDLAAGAVKRLKVGRRLLDGGTEDRVLEITVHPGWKSGTKVRFPHAGNEQPGGAAQDLVFVVEEKPHAVFTRDGNDLKANIKLPLVEALCGPAPGAGRLSKTLELLDGRKLQIPVPLGTVKPGQAMTITGEGMPVRKDGQVQSKGDLIVTWEVVLPERLTPAQKEELRRVLAA